MKTAFALILTAFLTLPLLPASAAPPDHDHRYCGPDSARSTVLVARDREASRRRAREIASCKLPAKSAPNVFQAGEILVMEDDGSTLISPPNLFDLEGRGMQFLRRPKGMSVVRTNLGFKQLIGERVELGDDDSIFIEFPAGFEFPFGDEVYSGVFLNSDGNLTFGVPESFSSRSLEDLVAGPPRLAPFYGDLDPSATSAESGTGVFVNFPPNRVRITWKGVPQFDRDDANSFQVTLFTTGRATFVVS